VEAFLGGAELNPDDENEVEFLRRLVPTARQGKLGALKRKKRRLGS
jgi:hypothetical protein